MIQSFTNITGNVKYDCNYKMSVSYFVFQRLKLRSFEVSCKKNIYKFCSENALIEGFSAKNLRKLLSCVKATVTNFQNEVFLTKEKKCEQIYAYFQTGIGKKYCYF